MMQILWSLLAFIIAVSILVTVHEFGHFYVARLVGVKVLRFSIGFGKALYRRQCKSGVEFIIAAVPLGGYVKMLDEREGDVIPADLPYAFNRQSVWRRMAIILAGPLFNILFAILAYWLILIIGDIALKPVIGEIAPHSIAAQAGLQSNDEFVGIAQASTPSWEAVRLQLLTHLGEKKTLSVKVMRDGQAKQLHLNLTDWQVDQQMPRPLETLGITPYYPPMPFIITKVMPGSAAAEAGLQAGDKIITLNEQTFTQLPALIDTISEQVNQVIRLTIERDGMQQSLPVRVDPVADPGSFAKGRIGIQFESPAWPESMLVTQRYSLMAACLPALQKTWDMTALSFALLGKMVVGEISVKSVSGPIGIAQGAGYSASLGVAPFLTFLALVSISLAIINILPIPLLDGGHFAYCLFELVFRRPVSEKVQWVATRLGLVFLLTLMVVAFYNDIARW
jgi:regulator of sigma E protease